MNGGCCFVSDLHGHAGRYAALAGALVAERPRAVFLGGDLLPHGGSGDFVDGFLAPLFEGLRQRLGRSYPDVALILGNDDPRSAEAAIARGEAAGLWRYAHLRRLELQGVPVRRSSAGPSCVKTLSRTYQIDAKHTRMPGWRVVRG